MSAVVYRVFDRNDALLYIGSTRDINARKAIHMADRKSPIAYPMQTCAVRWETQEFPTYEAAKAAEVAAIEAEVPYLNRQHNPKRWRRIDGEWTPLLPPYELAFKWEKHEALVAWAASFPDA
jgi:predicted GIY-YIG superfamily endonuclease